MKNYRTVIVSFFFLDSRLKIKMSRGTIKRKSNNCPLRFNFETKKEMTPRPVLSTLPYIFPVSLLHFPLSRKPCPYQIERIHQKSVDKRSPYLSAMRMRSPHF